jgi:hypothetical protein
MDLGFVRSVLDLDSSSFDREPVSLGQVLQIVKCSDIQSRRKVLPTKILVPLSRPLTNAFGFRQWHKFCCDYEIIPVKEEETQ